MSTYTASIEWICDHAGVVRLHDSDSGRVGDPYVWAATLARSGESAELMGVTAPIGRPAARALLGALAASGIRRLIRRRIRSGQGPINTRPLLCQQTRRSASGSPDSPGEAR